MTRLLISRARHAGSVLARVRRAAARPHVPVRYAAFPPRDMFVPRASGPAAFVDHLVPRVVLGSMALVLLLAGALLVPASPVLAQAQAPPRTGVPDDETARIRGLVLDLTTGQPIVEAAIRLVPPDGSEPEVRTTDANGRFVFPLLVPGMYGIELFRLGYGDVRDSLAVDRGSEIDLVAELAPEAIQLPAVVVATSRRSRLESNGFYQRRRTMNGRFIGRQEIEERSPAYLSDLLRTIPSLRLTPLAHGLGSAVTGRGGCRPTYFLDGVRLIDSNSLDAFVPPGDLDGIEVYTSSSAPVQYAGSRCGSIVLWSRSPAPEAGRGSAWKKFIAAASFLGGVILLTR